MSEMDELRLRIEDLAEEAKLICRNRGLKTMNRVTIIIRDINNPNMQFVVSDDSECSFAFWFRPEDYLPDTNGWVLADIRPTRNGDVQDPNYLALANYDGVEWRTKYGRTPAGYKVLKWCAIPTPEDAAFYASAINGGEHA